MKSKFVKSMVGLTCLLGVNAASADVGGNSGSQEVENSGSYCENGQCLKHELAGFYVGAGLDWIHGSNIVALDRQVSQWGISSVYGVFGERGGNNFSGDVHLGYRFSPVEYCVFGIELGAKLGKNSKKDFDEKFNYDLAYIGPNGGLMPGQTGRLAGKITEKRSRPYVAVVAGWYACPFKILVYTKFGVSRKKIECEVYGRNAVTGAVASTTGTASMSGAFAFWKVGAERKVYKNIGVFTEFEYDFPMRKDAFVERVATATNMRMGESYRLSSRAWGLSLGVTCNIR